MITLLHIRCVCTQQTLPYWPRNGLNWSTSCNTGHDQRYTTSIEPILVNGRLFRTCHIRACIEPERFTGKVALLWLSCTGPVLAIRIQPMWTNFTSLFNGNLYWPSRCKFVSAQDQRLHLGMYALGQVRPPADLSNICNNFAPVTETLTGPAVCQTVPAQYRLYRPIIGNCYLPDKNTEIPKTRVRVFCICA